MEIKVLGSGCANCKALLAETQKAVAAKGINAEVEYVTDMQQIMESGVMSMPALMVNGNVVSAGRVLKENDIIPLLAKDKLL